MAVPYLCSHQATPVVLPLKAPGTTKRCLPQSALWECSGPLLDSASHPNGCCSSAGEKKATHKFNATLVYCIIRSSALQHSSPSAPLAGLVSLVHETMTNFFETSWMGRIFRQASWENQIPEFHPAAREMQNNCPAMTFCSTISNLFLKASEVAWPIASSQRVRDLKEKGVHVDGPSKTRPTTMINYER